MIADMRLGERVYELRRRNGLSQGELANELNVSRQSVSKWENGQSSPEIENLIAMSPIFHVSVDEIINSVLPLSRESEAEEVGCQSDKPILGYIFLGIGILLGVLGIFLNFFICILGVVLLIVGICAITFKKGQWLRNSWIVFFILYLLTIWFANNSFLSVLNFWHINYVYQNSAIRNVALRYIITTILAVFFILLSVLTIKRGESSTQKVQKALCVFALFGITECFGNIKTLVTAPFMGVGDATSYIVAILIVVFFAIYYIKCRKILSNSQIENGNIYNSLWFVAGYFILQIGIIILSILVFEAKFNLMSNILICFIQPIIYAVIVFLIACIINKNKKQL